MLDSRRYPSINRWDDLNVGASAVRAPGIADPGFSTAYAAWLFDGNATTETLLFNFQLPHAWLEGSSISPHVHWAKSTSAAGNVRWVLDYKWASLGSVIDSSWTQLTVAAPVADTADTNTAFKQLLSSFGSIDATGRKISDVFICKLSRVPTHADDTYGADALMLFFDIHVKIDSLGSTYLYRKTYEAT